MLLKSAQWLKHTLLLQRGATEAFCGQPRGSSRPLPAHVSGAHKPHTAEGRQATAAGAWEGHLHGAGVSAQRAQQSQKERLH